MTTRILLVAVILASQTKSDGSKWVEATSSDGAFSFAMPAKPVERTVVQRSANGPINILEYSCTSDDCLFKIEKSKLPVEIPEEKLEGALGASRDSVAKKTKLLADKPTTVAGWPARELTIEASLRPGASPSKITILILFADQEFYQVRAFSLKPGMPPKHVRKFFDSFKPKKVRAGAKGA
jgi:hypothetical protein